MIKTGIQGIKGTIENFGIGAAGILGVENAAPIAEAIEQTTGIAESAAASPNWIQPVIQGIIAILTIVAQMFRGRKARSAKD